MIAAICAGLAMWLAFPSPASMPRQNSETRSVLWPLAWAAALMIGFTIGGVGGVLAGIAIVIGLPKLIAMSARRRDDRLRAQDDGDLPAVASLLAALLSSGATIEASVRALATSHRGALAPALLRVDAVLRLGAAPEEAWQAAPSALAPIASALRRSTTSGAPAAAVLGDVVTDAQRVWRSRAEVAARAAGVQAILPLIVCFLPAFFLVGVVPVVVSVAGSVVQ